MWDADVLLSPSIISRATRGDPLGQRSVSSITHFYRCPRRMESFHYRDADVFRCFFHRSFHSNRVKSRQDGRRLFCQLNAWNLTFSSLNDLHSCFCLIRNVLRGIFANALISLRVETVVDNKSHCQIQKIKHSRYSKLMTPIISFATLLKKKNKRSIALSLDRSMDG